MPLLTRFWELIERSPDPVTVEEQWRKDLDEELPPVRSLIRSNGRTASTYPHPTRYGKELAVVHQGDGQVFAVDEGRPDGIRIALTPDDIALHELVRDRLAATVARALGLRAQPERLGVALHRVGWWAMRPGAEHPVFLHLGGAYVAAVDFAYRCVAECNPPFLLLIPTRRMWPARSNEILRRHRCLAIPLDDVICANGQAWSALPSWADCQVSFRQLVHPEPLTLAEEPYVFRKTGEVWVITFAGKTTYLADALGQCYIAHMLANPGRKILALDLLAIVSGQEAARHPSSAGDVADRQALEQARSRYQELLDERDEADRDNDLAAQERIETERDQIAEYLSQAKGFNGRTPPGLR